MNNMKQRFIWTKEKEQELLLLWNKKSLYKIATDFHTTPEKLIEIDEIIKEGVKRGHSIANILYENKNLIECSERTIYKYIEEGLLSIKNIDLRRKVRYKPRKNKKDKQRVLEMQKGRTYDDFIQYTSITERASRYEENDCFELSNMT